MKKSAIVLFLITYLIVAMFTVIASVQVSDNSSQVSQQSQDNLDIIATSPFEKCSYEDYIYYGNPDTWIYPQAFIGSSAIFNIENTDDWAAWSNFTIASKDEIAELAAIEYNEDDYAYDQFDVVEDTELTVNGESIKVVISDYVLNVYDEEYMIGDLWFKVEAAEGYTLPEKLAEKPYILHLTSYDDVPSLLFTATGMFTTDTVTFYKQPVAATIEQALSTSYLPVSFEIYSYITTNQPDYEFYDLGNVSAWEAETKPKYQYVKASEVELVPITVAHAYESLITASSSIEFESRISQIPERILASFTAEHKANLVALCERFAVLENVEFSNKVTLDGTELNVAVKGKIPIGTVRLETTLVPDEDILNGGFGITNADEIIIALDIKLLNTADNTEWQPEEGYPVELSIDMAALGYEDGSLVRLHHKHGDKVDTYDIFIVEDGKITFVTDSFSIYAVQQVGDTNTSANATLISHAATTNNNNITIYIGDEKIYYIRPNNGTSTTNFRTPVKGTWVVTDTTGAIHYNVHSNVASTAIGNARVNAQWISIVALKETPENQPITLTFRYLTTTNTNWGQQPTIYKETYNLYVKKPLPTTENGGRRLYIKDMVNSTGTITAAIIDSNGNENNDLLAGAAFEWTRDDGLFIVPQAYKNDFKSVSIVQDHGGLVESRKKYNANKEEIGYQPVTYTLRATLSDGTVLTDSYTVYYQSEIINASFEFPVAVGGQHNFFPNGYTELYWKTTAPGSNAAKLTQDVEYGSVVKDNRPQDNANYGVSNAADGKQFAEINAEEFGALYQDIITQAGEPIDWDFMHAARQQQNNGVNSMFIVFGPTEQAQTLTTQAHVNGLGTAVKNAVADRSKYTKQQSDDFYAGKLGITITYSYPNSGVTADYTVWYHTVDRSKNNGWVELKGEYIPPEGQYRTRVFFVTDAAGVTRNENYGNMIDSASAGQYKTFLIEYYEESYSETTNELIIKYWSEKDEKGKALIYSSRELENFTFFETENNDYLHSILINGKNYPYDIRYAEKPSIYIEKYPGKGSDATKRNNLVDEDYNPITNTNNYGDYDLVIQIYFRDTVIAVQKELKLPTYEPAVPGKSEEVPGMTDEQKLKLFDELNASADGGYKTTFTLTSTDNDKFKDESETTVISKRDPAGKYTAYVALGENPPLGSNYVVSEVLPENPTGLVLNKVTFIVRRYYMGVSLDDLMEEVSYEIIEREDLDENGSVSTNNIFLGDIVHNEETKSIKIADVTVINEYIEKETTIYYEAVGNGKVAIAEKDENGNALPPNFQDTPTETLDFYSGVAKGADVFAGHGAKFVGWYTDPECTNKVDLEDGIVDENGNFKPNSNIINAEKVTFYAKFETNSVKIERTNGTPNQTYVYKVEAFDNNNKATVMYVTVKCDANGNGYTEILEAVSSRYVVTEIGDWAWRSDDGESVNKEQSFATDSSGTDLKNHMTITFNGNVKKQEWLNGFSESQKNVYNESGGGS